MFFKKYEYTNLPKRLWKDEDLSKKEISKYKNGFNQDFDNFSEALKEKFIPYLRSIKFKGGKKHFYKKEYPLVFCVSIEKDKYGGSCYLLLGVHLEFAGVLTLKELGSREGILHQYDSKHKFITHDCKIQKVLSLDNGVNEFYYGRSLKETYETADIMIELFEKKGITFFDKFGDYPHPFDKITYKEIKQPNDNFIEYEIKKSDLDFIHFQMIIAQFHLHEQNHSEGIKIINNIYNSEYNTNRFTKKGVSPFLGILKEIKEKYN